jgi:hypothetical protein
MPLRKKDSGVWAEVNEMWIKDTTWKDIQEGWIKSGGVWSQFFSKTLPFLLYVGGDFTTVSASARNRIVSTDKENVLQGFNPNAGAAVYTILPSGSTIFIGGSFITMGGVTRNRVASVQIDSISGVLTAWNPNCNGGPVQALVADDTSVYIGGSAFGTVGGVTQNRIAKVTSDTGSVISLKHHLTGDNVYALDIDNDKNIYIGGGMTLVYGEDRNRVLSTNMNNGLISSFNPNAGSTVYSLLPSGSTLFIGGAFTTMSGVTRNRVASVVLDGISGSLTAWNPNCNGGPVRALVADDATVYIGGDAFGTVGGVTQNRITKVTSDTGAVISLKHHLAADNVSSVDIDSDKNVYIGGGMTIVYGETRNRALSTNMNNGLISSFHPNSNGAVNTILPSGTTIFIGGAYTTLQGTARSRVGAIQLDGISGTLTAWNPNCNGEVKCLVAKDTLVLIGGLFSTVNGVATSRFSPVTSDVGTKIPLSKYPNNDVYSISVSGDSIYLGGTFASTNDEVRKYALSVNTLNSKLLGFNPNANADVVTILPSSTTIFMGGSFTTLQGTTRNRAGAILLDGISGTVTSWNPNCGSTVNALAVSELGIYLGGAFTTVGGATSNGLTEVNASNGGIVRKPKWTSSTTIQCVHVSGSNVFVGGTFTSVAISASSYLCSSDISGNKANQDFVAICNNTVTCSSIIGSNLYIGGQFTSVGGLTRNRLAKVSLSTGAVDTWNPNAGGNVICMAADSSNIYVGGQFTTLGGIPRIKLGKISDTGTISATWTPSASNDVFSLFLREGEEYIYIGGTFALMNLTVTRNNGANVSTTAGTLGSWDPNCNGVIRAIYVTDSYVYIGGDFTAVNGGTGRNRIAATDKTNGTLIGWNPNCGNNVYCITKNSSTIYFGGIFGTVNSVTRNYAGAWTEAVNTTGVGTLSSWNPNCGGNVYSMCVANGGVHLGGTFTTVNTLSYNNIVKVALDTGGIDNLFNFYVTHSATAAVNTIVSYSDKMYYGGAFNAAGLWRSRALAVSASMDILDWVPKCSSTVQTIATSANRVYLGGSFTTVNGVSRQTLASVDPDLGYINTWNPNPSVYASTAVAYTIKPHRNLMYVGGNFQALGGTTRIHTGAVDPDTGGLNAAWNPSIAVYGGTGGSFVRSINISGTNVYLGGAFYSVSGATQYPFTVVNDTNGGLEQNSNVFISNSAATVSTYVIVPGDDAIYVGGTFDLNANLRREKLCRYDNYILSDWITHCNGTVVNSVVAISGILYFGGNFTGANGVARNRCGAVNAETGELLAWNPNANGTVNTIYPTDSKIYIGGAFTSIGGQSRSYAGAVDTVNGTATIWNPNLVGTNIFTIAGSGSLIYIGGNLSSSNGTTQSMATVVDSISGKTDPNSLCGYDNDTSNAYVYNIVPYDGSLYICGLMQYGRYYRNRVYSLTQSGNMRVWTPNVGGTVRTLNVSGNTVYIGGDFTLTNNTTRNRVAAINRETGELFSWNPNANNSVYSMHLKNSTVYLGGAFTTVGGQSRSYAGAVDHVSGLATIWNAALASTNILTIESSGSMIFLGGNISSSNGVAQSMVTVVDEISGKLDPNSLCAYNNGTSNGYVERIKAHDGNLYIGGAMTFGQYYRNKVYSLTQNGNMRPWTPNFGNTVRVVSISGDTIYIGGDYTSVNSITRNRAAAIDKQTGDLLPWNPNCNQAVYTIEPSGDRVYIGGNFTTIGGTSRGYAGVVDSVNGTSLYPWNPSCNALVNSLTFNGRNIYLGGNFTTVAGGVSRNYACSVHAVTGGVTEWKPNPNGQVRIINIGY